MKLYGFLPGGGGRTINTTVEAEDVRTAIKLAEAAHSGYRVSCGGSLPDTWLISMKEYHQVQRDRAAIEAVRRLHVATEYECQGYREDGSYGMVGLCCVSCGTADEYGEPWPCATARALGAEPSSAGADRSEP